MAFLLTFFLHFGMFLNIQNNLQRKKITTNVKSLREEVLTLSVWSLSSFYAKQQLGSFNYKINTQVCTHYTANPANRKKTYLKRIPKKSKVKLERSEVHKNGSFHAVT